MSLCAPILVKQERKYETVTEKLNEFIIVNKLRTFFDVELCLCHWLRLHLKWHCSFLISICSARNVYLDVPKEVDEAEQEGGEKEEEINVTMNPLEKFETADDQEVHQDTTNQKTLEWDDAYIA